MTLHTFPKFASRALKHLIKLAPRDVICLSQGLQTNVDSEFKN